jgi:hypothetical protein
VPWRPVVRVNGTLLPATAADYNPAQAEVAFALTAGAHAVVLARQAS